MSHPHDCVICGSCVIDVLCRPVELDRPIGHGTLHRTGSLRLAGGGITINAGVTMARLGARVAVLSFVGSDPWGPIVRDLLKTEGVDDSLLLTHPDEPTSTTVVLIDDAGDRSFLHCVGAPKRIDARMLLDRLEAIAAAGFFLLGYYSLLPHLEDDLAGVLAAIRSAGGRTALDAAGGGGDLDPLVKLLPHLDVYVPSYAEASHQTGESDPRRIIEVYRRHGATGLLGVKLGPDGVLLSPADRDLVEIPAATPPGPVLDTTGAGDCFYGGLLFGLLRGWSVEHAGRLGAAAASCCIASVGGSTGGRDLAETAALAGLAPPVA